MNDRPHSPREKLFRDAVMLQLKLVADGFRDALLIPISLVAAGIGLVRGGADCDAEFRRVIDLGRRSERWINLFGHEEPLNADSPIGSIDRIVGEVESIVIEQHRQGRSAAEIRAAIRAALQRSPRKAPDRGSAETGKTPGAEDDVTPQ